MSRAIAVLFIWAMVITPEVIHAQIPATDNGENKCGGCPCNTPCYTSPPPPSPPPPSPPLPSPPPPSPPPPPKYLPYCPPPPDHILPFPPAPVIPIPPGTVVPFPSAPTPPSQSIYATGPPGDVYPVDHGYGKAGRSLSSSTVWLAVLFIICSVLQLAV